MKFKTQKEKLDLIKSNKTNWHTNASNRVETANKLLNLRFLNNDQWIYFDTVTNTIERQEYDQNVGQVTANWFLPYHESIKARILSMNPRARMVPQTRDWSDWTTALAYTKFYKGIFNNIDWEDYLQDMVDIQLNCGGVWIRPYWNKDLKQGKFKGEVDFDIRSDITAYVDPLAITSKSVRYITYIDIVSREWVNDKYGKDFKADRLDQELGGWLLTVFGELKKASQHYDKTPNVDMNDAVILTQMHYRDGDKAKVIIEAKGEILEEYDAMFFDTYIPYFKNRFYWKGRTLLDSLRGVQREINMTLTQYKAEAKRVPKLIKDSSIEIPDDKTTFDMDTSEIVEVNFTRPNAYLQVHNPPSPTGNERFVWRDQWSEVGGQSEASRGNLPGSQTAGIAIDRLVDQDETKIGNAKSNLRIGLKKVFKQVKEIIDKHYSDDRAVAVAGRQRAYEVFTFSKFKKRTAWFDVDCEIGGALPTTPGAKIGSVTQMLQMGVFADLPNPAKYARELMDLSVLEMDNIDIDFDKQQVEIEELIAGEPVSAQQFDDHIVHIQVLLNFLKTKDFEDLDSKHKTMVFAHLGQHRVVVEMMMKQQAATQQGSQPAQPGNNQTNATTPNTQTGGG